MNKYLTALLVGFSLIFSSVAFSAVKTADSGTSAIDSIAPKNCNEGIVLTALRFSIFQDFKHSKMSEPSVVKFRYANTGNSLVLEGIMRVLDNELQDEAHFKCMIRRVIEGLPKVQPEGRMALFDKFFKKSLSFNIRFSKRSLVERLEIITAVNNGKKMEDQKRLKGQELFPHASSREIASLVRTDILIQNHWKKLEKKVGSDVLIDLKALARRGILNEKTLDLLSKAAPLVLEALAGGSSQETLKSNQASINATFARIDRKLEKAAEISKSIKKLKKELVLGKNK